MPADGPVPDEPAADPVEDDGGRRRPLLVALAALVVVGAVVGAVVVSSDDSPDKLEPVDEERGLAEARLACAGVDELVRMVEANAASDTVFDQIDLVVEHAMDAVEHDPTWLPLASGTQAVRKGFQVDSAEPTRAGIDVVQAECQRARSGRVLTGPPED